MRVTLAICVLIAGLSALALYANNKDKAHDHIRVDTSKYEGIDHNG